jgi:hypothetical protein
MKDRHQVKHPDYVYKPRKTSEKKRRMSRKKSDKLVKLFESLAGSGSKNKVQAFLNSMEGDHVTVEDFNQLAGTSVADYLLLGDSDLNEKNLEGLVESHDSDVVAALGSNNVGPLFGSLTNPTGYVAPSTAIALDEVNDIIQWAEGHTSVYPDPNKKPHRPWERQYVPGVPNHIMRAQLQAEYNDKIYAAAAIRAERLRWECVAAERAERESAERESAERESAATESAFPAST